MSYLGVVAKNSANIVQFEKRSTFSEPEKRTTISEPEKRTTITEPEKSFPGHLCAALSVTPTMY